LIPKNGKRKDLPLPAVLFIRHVSCPPFLWQRGGPAHQVVKSVGLTLLFFWWLSVSSEPNPHIFEPLRPLIMKKHKAIMITGNIHQRGKLKNSEPDMCITSFLDAICFV
jgi:hypothetical protein